MKLHLGLRLWWRRPQDPKQLGREAIRLAGLILGFSDGPDIGKITNPVRQGFAYNFDTETGGPFRQKWRDLAERTRREREQLGFQPEHPILERTGNYKSSWINRMDPRHFEKQHRHGQMTGGGLVGQNMLTIHVGSIDYRAPIHELGLEMPEHLVERERMLSGLPEALQGEGTGAVPARPVRFIANEFLDNIGRGISNLLDSKMGEIKGPR